jgi:hypothetical protein
MSHEAIGKLGKAPNEAIGKLGKAPNEANQSGPAPNEAIGQIEKAPNEASSGRRAGVGAETARTFCQTRLRSWKTLSRQRFRALK